MTFEEIYQKVKNPLDDEQNINKLIDIYKKSKRMGNNFESMESNGINHNKSMYTNIASSNSNDSSKYNAKDEEIFMVNLYNSWIKNMISLTPEQKKQVSSKYNNLDGLIDTLKKVGKVSTLQDVENLKKNPLVGSEQNNIEYLQGISFNHIESSKVSGYSNSINGYKHRLYIGAKYKDIYKLVNEFAESCTQNGYPYYFKLDVNHQNRVDTVVIYSDDENFTNYINILDNIKQKYPDIAKDCGEPSLVVGNYDGWIGIADEPAKIYRKKDGSLDNPSFTQTRAAIIEESMDLVLADEYEKCLKNQGKLNYNGKERTIQECFRYKLLETLKEEAQCPNDSHPIFDFQNLSSKQKEDVKSQFINLINNFSNADLDKMVDIFKNTAHERWIKSPDSMDFCNLKLAGKSVDIYNSTGKKIEWGITPRIVDYAMKKMVDVFQENNPIFTQEVKKKIEETCASPSHRVDADKFVFNADTRTRMNAMGFKPTPPPVRISNLVYNSKDLEDKINYLKSLSFENKKMEDYAQELKEKSGQTREDLSCVYASFKGSKCNVKDLTYKEIEKTIFEIVNLQDYNKSKSLLTEYMSVLNKAGYVPSYGTLGRAFIEMDKIDSSSLDNKGARKDFLRNALGKGNGMLQDCENICKYIKDKNNISIPLSNQEKSAVLLKMQDNYNKFGLQPNSNKPQNYSKLINANNVPKNSNIQLSQKSTQEMQDEENLHKGYRDYGFKSCPFSITNENGEKQDVWNLGATEIITDLLIAINSGDKNEIRKMRIVCENMQGHFNPSYNDMAKLTMVINDYWKLNDNPEIDKAIDCLKDMSKDKYNEAFAIAKFNAQKEGRVRATYPEMVEVFKDLERQQQLKKQTQNQTSGYSGGM